MTDRHVLITGGAELRYHFRRDGCGFTALWRTAEYLKNLATERGSVLWGIP